MNQYRTDLALETNELLQQNKESLKGIREEKKQKGELFISKITLTNDETAKKIGKAKGNYTTITFPDPRFLDTELFEQLCNTISAELKELLPKTNTSASYAVIGLGNRLITSDSLGPSVLNKLLVTRHFHTQQNEQFTKLFHSVCAIAPGVLGITGIETEEIISAICEKTKPGAVICIDALAARSMHRIMKTIQITDTGIRPGAGVGNNRKEISKETLGIPVIAIGVPTVINAATITEDFLNLVADKIYAGDNNQPVKEDRHSDNDTQFSAFFDSVADTLPDFMTTPKEIDILIQKASDLIAYGLNLALHENLTYRDMINFVS